MDARTIVRVGTTSGHDVLVLAHVVGWNRTIKPMRWSEFSSSTLRVMTADRREWLFSEPLDNKIEAILLDYFNERHYVDATEPARAPEGA
jgi:hypothetical protein